MADISDEQQSEVVRITGQDETNPADVTLDAGRWKLETLSTVQVGVGLGKDPLPDTYFTVTVAGAIGDTVRVQIAGTNKDSTNPDRDFPAVDVTYTLVAADVGDEEELAKNITAALNADNNMVLAELESAIVNTNRSIVHISSKVHSLQGEFAERPNTGDVSVTTTGTTATVLAFDNLIARAKETTLARDPNNPHRAGVIGVSGSIQIDATDVNNLLEIFATNGGAKDISVDGSTTPQVFTIDANPLGQNNIVIETITLYGEDTNIKVGESNFLGTNAALTNGILIEVVKGGVTSTFRNLQTTNDILARFSSSPEKNKIINQSGGDFIQSSYSLSAQRLQFTLEAGTTDQIKVTVRDNISSVSSLFFKGDGFEEAP